MTNKVSLKNLFLEGLKKIFYFFNFALFFDTETAINIGYSCQLLTDDMADIFIVDGHTYDDVEEQLTAYKDAVRNQMGNSHSNSSTSPQCNNHRVVETTDSYNPPTEVAYRSQPSSDHARNNVTGTTNTAVSIVTFRWDRNR